MDTIKLTAVVGEDRRLVIDLPQGTPVGPVELTIRPATHAAREEARARLLAAGVLATRIRAPGGTEPLSPDEVLHLGTLPPGARPSESLIDDDRGER